jgi:outer membrane immunogenic protein
MKRWLLLLLAGAAGAAHADSEAWKGGYLGVNAGAIRAKSKWLTDVATGQPAAETVEHTGNGAFVGAQIGYRFPASDRLLLGLEFTYQGADIKTRGPSSLVPTRDRETRVRNPLALTAQLGWTGDRNLLFVRGGFVRADVRLETHNPAPLGATAVWEHHASGWTAGVGFERLVGRRLSVGAAIDYSKLRAVDLSTLNNGGAFVQAERFETSLRAFAVRANYRF